MTSCLATHTTETRGKRTERSLERSNRCRVERRRQKSVHSGWDLIRDPRPQRTKPVLGPTRVKLLPPAVFCVYERLICTAIAWHQLVDRGLLHEAETTARRRYEQTPKYERRTPISHRRFVRYSVRSSKRTWYVVYNAQHIQSDFSSILFPLLCINHVTCVYYIFFRVKFKGIMDNVTEKKKKIDFIIIIFPYSWNF